MGRKAFLTINTRDVTTSSALCKTNVQSDSPCWRGVYKIKEKTTRRFVGDKLSKRGTSIEVDRAKPETLPHRQNTLNGIFFLWRLAGLLLLPFCESALGN
jgi:hypothetical protein